MCLHQDLLAHADVELGGRWSGLPGGTGGEELTRQCRRCKRCRCDPWVRKIPGGGHGNPLQIFLPGESHSRRSLAGYSPWGRKASDTTEAT